MKKSCSIALVVVVLVCMLAMPAFAASYTFGSAGSLTTNIVLKDNTATTLDDLDMHLYIFWHDSGRFPYLVMTSSAYYYKYDTNNKDYRVYTGDSVSQYYTIVTDANGYSRWVYWQDYNFTNINAYVPDSLLWCSHDIINVDDSSVWKSGDSNFQPTLPKIVIQMAGGELETVAIPKLTTTMRTLVLCGVGLMALLMVFPLLRKVFSRFLP